MLSVAIPLFAVLAGLVTVNYISTTMTGQNIIEITTNTVPQIVSFIGYIRETFINFFDILPNEISSILVLLVSIMFIIIVVKFTKGGS